MEERQNTKSVPASLADVGGKQRERLAYIEFRLYFLGDVRRQDIMSRFGVAPAVATRDFTLYRGILPENIRFDEKSKSYLIGEDFHPAFHHLPERVFTALSLGFGDGVNSVGNQLLCCEMPLTLNRPSLEILAPVTRAIHLQRPVSIRYQSHTSGHSERVIVPFALVNDGLRWHVRAFDRKSGEFRDFVFSRMSSAEILDQGIEKREMAAADNQWNRIVDLDLVPHPKRLNPEIIMGDYGMQNGFLRIHLRAAVAGYVLRQLIVDCSPDHQLDGEEYRLWLRNSLALYGVSTAKLAPGYQEPA